ncbi:MAG: hypothetical protein IT306_27205 [Chloroflexi bacterium]|nr:hypothetical protein [Chloroflexota bacterium]
MAEQARTANQDRRRVGRRAALGVWASGLMGVAGACGDRYASEIDGPDGKILQLERDDLLVLVSDFKGQYQPGDRIAVKVLINNQSSRLCQARIRTRLLGRGQQAVVEAEVATVNIRPFDATPTERVLSLPNNLPAGEYTLQVELPPWSFEGRQAGGGAMTTTIKIGA